MKYFVLFSGISGSGKTAVESDLKGLDYNGYHWKKLIQTTTRAPRSIEEEYDGSYVFSSKKYYDKLVKADLLMAASQIGDNYYGTFSDYEEDNMIYSVVVNAKGYNDIVSYLEDHKEEVGEYKIIHFNIVSNLSSSREGRDLDLERIELDSLDHSKADIFENVSHRYGEGYKEEDTAQYHIKKIINNLVK